MSDPGLALQAALFARLSAEISVPVYDAVPMDTSPPYVTFDNEIADNSSPLSGRQRANRLFYLSVWSDYAGQAEVKRINAEIYAALNQRPIELATGRAFGVRVERMTSNREPDGITYQGSVTLRVLTQQ